MKKTLIVPMLSLLAGCAMKEFSSTPFYSGSEVKFTGAVEDRVNLWPLGYWREPVGSVAWPLVSWGKDHLAFRPVWSQYKQRGGADYDEFNLLWPIGQFDTRHKDYRIFPCFWGSDRDGKDPYFCLFPALWWNDEFAGMFPFFWSMGKGGSGYCVFPLFWSETTESGNLWHTLFPLYYYGSHPKSETNHPSDTSEFWALAYLAGYNRKDGQFTDHRLLPFYLWNHGNFHSIPYSRYESDGEIKNRVMLGLAGSNSTTNGECSASWLFPIYYRDEGKLITPIGGKSDDANWVVPLYWQDKDSFASLPYWHKRGKDGKIDYAFSLPLLSGYERDDKTGDRLLCLLMGLGGHVWRDEVGDASWVFPLFYSDHDSFYTLLYGSNPRHRWLFPIYFDGEERTFITPFYGRNKKDGSDWLVPLYYHDKDSFITPIYGKSSGTEWLLPLYTRSDAGMNTIPLSYWDDAKKGTRGFVSVPLLSGASWKTNSQELTWVSLAGLIGGTSNTNGSKKCQWAFPLFYHDNDSFMSIPFGWENSCGYSNTYFAAGLAGVRSGKKEGGWLFPLFNKDKDADFDECIARLDATKLPEEIKVWTEITTNEVWNCKTRSFDKEVGPRKRSTHFSAYDNRTHFLFSDNDKSVYGNSYCSTNRYQITAHSELGNSLAFRREGRREVRFDMDTRAKISDCENSHSSLFLLLYRGEERADNMKGTNYTRHRVLWKLWDWEEENGDVSLDVFPGFTYDSKKNGYTKTSFLWRLFRYENAPEKGRELDFMFIPIWR